MALSSTYRSRLRVSIARAIASLRSPRRRSRAPYVQKHTAHCACSAGGLNPPSSLLPSRPPPYPPRNFLRFTIRHLAASSRLSLLHPELPAPTGVTPRPRLEILRRVLSPTGESSVIFFPTPFDYYIHIPPVRGDLRGRYAAPHREYRYASTLSVERSILPGPRLWDPIRDMRARWLSLVFVWTRPWEPGGWVQVWQRVRCSGI